MQKNILIIGVLFFLVVSSIPPLVFGYDISTFNQEMKIMSYNFDAYQVSEITKYEQYKSDKENSSLIVLYQKIKSIQKELLNRYIIQQIHHGRCIVTMLDILVVVHIVL
jgi:hypothetical protein